jgi:hypothetical protein
MQAKIDNWMYIDMIHSNSHFKIDNIRENWLAPQNKTPKVKKYKDGPQK